MKITLYTISKALKIGVYTAKNQFEDTFYHCEMPTLSARKSREIIRLATGGTLVDRVRVVVECGNYTGVQDIYKNGTILNF